jgi:hypothetical protein
MGKGQAADEIPQCASQTGQKERFKHRERRGSAQRSQRSAIRNSNEAERVADAEEFVGFARGDAGVGG